MRCWFSREGELGTRLKFVLQEAIKSVRGRDQSSEGGREGIDLFRVELRVGGLVGEVICHGI
jgi:hypothetical protein